MINYIEIVCLNSEDYIVCGMNDLVNFHTVILLDVLAIWEVGQILGGN